MHKAIGCMGQPAFYNEKQKDISNNEARLLIQDGK